MKSLTVRCSRSRLYAPLSFMVPTSHRRSSFANLPSSRLSVAYIQLNAEELRGLKITEIETFVVDAGWRPWQFCAVRTDEGITGYGEMSDGRNPYGVVRNHNRLRADPLGPRPDGGRSTLLGHVSHVAPSARRHCGKRAIAGVELALWDIKGQGSRRFPFTACSADRRGNRQQVYWSHCGSSQGRATMS